VTAALDVAGLTVTYRGRSGPVPALTDVDLTVAAGEVVGLVGGSGAGKSTVARAIAGLVRPERGSVRVAGAEVVGAGRAALRRIRRTLHLVFQDPYASLPPTLRVADVIAEPLVVHRIGDRAARADRAAAAATAVGLDRRHLGRFPHELSGGERQRVAFARALVCEPRLILLDEPSTGLDIAAREQLLESIDLLTETHPAVASVLVTHHLEELPSSTTHALLLANGRVVSAGPAADALTSEHVSEAFQHPIDVRHDDGRWHARAASRQRACA
jgi:peptide/nickel transport system ATP-binding protein